MHIDTSYHFLLVHLTRPPDPAHQSLPGTKSPITLPPPSLGFSTSPAPTQCEREIDGRV